MIPTKHNIQCRQQTSLEAYTKILPTLNNKQQQVYEVILHNNEITDQEIAETLGWEINRVTPRRLELVKQELVRCNNSKINKNGYRAYTWSAT